MALVPDQNAPPSSQNGLEAQLGSMVDICFVEAGLAEVLQTVVEVGGLGMLVVGIVHEPWLPRKNIGGKATEPEAFLRVQLKTALASPSFFFGGPPKNFLTPAWALAAP
jgi:hypothetical protein